uniref:G2/mitotic-specific cyclin-B2 n=1 Tax=Tetraodon nigroviridis TaxID=99883 RepID=H3DMQ0_TETNG
MPATRVKKPAGTAGGKTAKAAKVGSENQEEGPQVKRSSSPPHGAPKKRTAFIDITNAHKVQISLPGRKKDAAKNPVKKSAVPGPPRARGHLKNRSASAASEGREGPRPPLLAGQRRHTPAQFDMDSENADDCFLCPDYAKEIFDYLKQREERFVLRDYMPTQPGLTVEMRAVLVDWLVEVQENFELFHETLYLAVKVTDHYLSTVPVHRETLQLVGSTAMLIASKFEERSPPCVEDFLYICDDAYGREELISMEASILQTLAFDINIPIPYRFLRRYAKCVGAGMDTLTLARYYCEMSLMDMELVPERASLLASACLLMALLAKGLGGWSPVLQFHAGYQKADLAPVVRKLHGALAAPPDDKLRAIRNKYSHRVFFEVALLPLLEQEVLDEALT